MADVTFRDQAILLLSNLEEGREVRTYLQQFSKTDLGCFAVIKVGGALVAEERAALGQRLALLQALDLKPIVVFGSGPQLDAKLSAAGIETPRKDGLRVTPTDAVAIVAREAASTGLSLAEAITGAGGHAFLAPPSAVIAEAIDPDTYGRVGTALGVHAESIEQLLRTDAIPLVGCVAQDAEGRMLNVNADDIARVIAQAVTPQKIVFLTSTGGLLDETGAIIDSINLATDYDTLMAEDWVHSGMAVKLQQIRKLLDGLPMSSSVSMTDTKHMMKELFTHGGAGTLIRQGERILVSRDVDVEKLTPLIETAFGRPLRADYWAETKIDYVIHSERYRAAAVVTNHGGIPCLDKFAVSHEARGEGLAKAVWKVLRQEAPNLIWRSRPSNPFNGFYVNAADGFLRADPWLVLWCGDVLGGEALRLAKEVAQRPPDFAGDAA